MQHRLNALTNHYTAGDNSPTDHQFSNLINGDLNAPLTVVNFFKFRKVADASLINNESMTGLEAFTKYAETSVPKVSKVGGRFLLRGGVEGSFIGSESPKWDVIAIGEYPRRECFIHLLEDTEYKIAFRYRQAAIAVQNVFLINPL